MLELVIDNDTDDLAQIRAQVAMMMHPLVLGIDALAILASERPDLFVQQAKTIQGLSGILAATARGLEKH